ncbi:hypothetical protein FBZ90_12225 [Nitrospirillum pindoramense]|uniref:Uncharacterized protein n=1 Tax=Nitrospirillum amazonense TaxID=28077 RepID=A0A560GMB9_9PROT|nr:hypothetical protein FBZ90_12225 [Nitrospirillum amazonense]
MSCDIAPWAFSAKASIAAASAQPLTLAARLRLTGGRRA